MSSLKTFSTVPVIGFDVSAASFDQYVRSLTSWAQDRRESRVVCVANVHMLVEARRDSSFAAILRQADAVTPDGMPLVWALRRRGAKGQERVAGLDLLHALCAGAEHEGIPVYFLGSTAEILNRIDARAHLDYPSLRIAGLEALPFREMTPSEDAALTNRVAESGAGFVFVALGCPKQEKWMHAHRGKIKAVMVGLGAAFALFAGVEPRAPRFIRDRGLEWLFRLFREPRRLWKRYLLTNSLFALYMVEGVLRSRHPRE